MTKDGRIHTARAVARVNSWAELYTIGLPDGVRSDRLGEVRSDLHEQVAAARGRASDRALAGRILGRSFRGALADVSWRRDVLRGSASRPASRAIRVGVSLAIVVGVVASALLFASSGAASSDASLAQVQVGYLKDQVRSEALFVVPLSSQFAEDLRDLGSDPNYTEALIQDREGVATEQNNFRVLLSQLVSEQRRATSWGAVANDHSVAAGWLGGLTAAALVLFGLVLWFEPRWGRRPARP